MRVELHADVSKAKGIALLANVRPWKTRFMRYTGTMRTVGVNYYATHQDAMNAATAWTQQGELHIGRVPAYASDTGFERLADLASRATKQETP